MTFEKDGVSGIGFVHCIGKITYERDEANDEVHYHIEQHLHAQSLRKSAVNSFARFHNHHCKRSIASIANAVVHLLALVSWCLFNRFWWNLQWNDPNHTSPPEADSAQTEKSIIQLVGSAFDLGQDLGIILGETWRDGLATLLGLLSKCTTEA
jgi:hypothetical protein